jgi:hypothetical protein
MSENIWESQLEINQIFDKRIELLNKQLTAVTELAITQGKMLAELAKLLQPTTPTEPTGCTGKHCACKAGEM